jgi:hypothetical protein
MVELVGEVKVEQAEVAGRGPPMAVECGGRQHK